jgi:uncharacterized protein
LSRRTLLMALVCLLPPAVTPAQAQSGVAQERADYTRWLLSAATSPLAAVAQQPIGAVLRLGPPDADVPLAGVGEQRVSAGAGGVRLESASGSRLLPRGVPVKLADYTLIADGPPGREVLTVFGQHHLARPPVYFNPSPSYVFVGPLLPPERRATVRVLGADGIEVEAAEAGSVVVPLGDGRVRLRVLRLPVSGGEESDLEIFFRDETNGRGSYPAGRFVSLGPIADGRYRLDFNRARNPFCAYSSAYPCPAPWRGNAVPAPVPAGERYEGGGLSDPGARREAQ